MSTDKVIQDFNNALKTQLVKSSFNQKLLCDAFKKFHKLQGTSWSSKEGYNYMISFMNKKYDYIQQILHIVYNDCSKEFLAWKRYKLADKNRNTRTLKKYIETKKHPKEIEFIKRQIEKNQEYVSLLKMDYKNIKQFDTTNYEFVFSLLQKFDDITCV